MTNRVARLCLEANHIAILADQLNELVHNDAYARRAPDNARYHEIATLLSDAVTKLRWTALLDVVPPVE